MYTNEFYRIIKSASFCVKQEGAVRECKKLFKKGADPRVLIQLEELFLIEQKEYYIRTFLPALLGTIVQSKLDNRVKQEVARVISEIIRHSDKGLSSNVTQDRRGSTDSEPESGYGSDAGDDYLINNGPVSDTATKTSNRITSNDTQLPNAIDKGNCKDVSNTRDQKEKLEEKYNVKALLRKSQDVLQKTGRGFKAIRKCISPDRKAEIIDDGYPLHKAVLSRDKNEFSELLQSDYDIANQNKDGNNVLHLIVKEPKKEQKLEFLSIVLKAGQKEQFVKAVHGKDGNGQTPLHQLLWSIKEKSEKRSCTDRKFEKTNRYRVLKLLLQNEADITVQDKRGNNALHYIASLEGEQKIICLKLISSLVEEKPILKDQLRDAINATNEKGQTPLEVALIKKAKKGKHLSQVRTISNLKSGHDNTTEFCVMLLQKGADSNQLDLKDKKFHTDKYYLVLRNLKDSKAVPQEIRSKARELKEKLEEKYNVKTFSKEFQDVLQKTGRGFKAVWKFVSPGKKALLVTIITVVALSCLQGQMAIGAAIPIIAITGVICLVFTLGLSGIKKSLQGFTTNEQGMPNGERNNKQQDLESKYRNLEEQEKEKPSDQSKDDQNPPNSVLDAILPVVSALQAAAKNVTSILSSLG